MGMFDCLYEGERGVYGNEWQTKAYSCNLDSYWVGDRMLELDKLDTYQVEIMGGNGHDFINSLATVVNGVLVSIDNERAHTLPLFSYGGHLIDGEQP